MRIAVVLLAALCMGTPIGAQSVVGTAIVGGRGVELLDDQTWRYRDEAPVAAACTRVDDRVGFCGKAPMWKSLPLQAEFDGFYQSGGLYHAGIVADPVGTDSGITMDFMRKLMLENAAGASGTRVNEIPVFETSETQIDGRDAEIVVYGAQIEGLSFVFANAAYVDPELSIQAMVWVIGTEYSDAHRARLDTFLSEIRIAEAASE